MKPGLASIVDYVSMDADGFVSVGSELRRRHASRSVFGGFQVGKLTYGQVEHATVGSMGWDHVCPKQREVL